MMKQDPIARCRVEKEAASAYVAHGGTDVRGAMQGFADWCVEEQLIEEEFTAGERKLTEGTEPDFGTTSTPAQAMTPPPVCCRQSGPEPDEPWARCATSTPSGCGTPFESERQQPDYARFLTAKRKAHTASGFPAISLHAELKDFQAYLVAWALRLGRAAIFSDCGTGKTFMQLEWARNVHLFTGRDVLILAPLAVSLQTQREGRRFDIPVTVCRSQADVRQGINITNYEMLHHFSAAAFAGIVLDESSILKSFTGKMRNSIIESFGGTPFRLACTATPSPNDYMELGNHSEFLGAASRTAMLATYFNHDGGETSKWRLKGHGVKRFWEWVASWAVMLRTPSNLGFSDTGYILPPLRRHIHTVETHAQAGFLFPVEASDLSERRESRKVSLQERVRRCAQLVNASDAQWLVWGDLNVETEAAAKAITSAVEVAGAHSDEHKAATMLAFADRALRVMVTKGKIAGFGMNFQNCHNMARLGLSDSHELMYQEERRCWRFGQTHPVESHYFVSDRDSAVIRNIDRKRQQADVMSLEMTEAMKRYHD
jgi:hypothetical protein